MRRTMLKSKIHRARVMTGADPRHGDTVIIVSYADLSEDELERYGPRVVHVDDRNSIVQVDDRVAELAA